jgi:hypothetical protein
MNILWRIVAFAIPVGAVVLAFRLASEMDQGETAGGQLTGPMILACFASLPVLAAGIMMRNRLPRIALSLWIGGTLLTAPLATYDLFPGWWSQISPWPDPDGYIPPMFVAEWDSMLLLLLLLSCLAFQAWLSAK